MPRGRPTKLTHQVRTILSEALEKGMPITEACQLAGIGERTYYDWKARAEKGGAKNATYSAFFADLAEARARGHEVLLDTIRESAVTDWKPASWLLERTRPELYGQTLTVRVQAEVAKELAAFLAACRDELDEETWGQVKGVAERMGQRGRHGGVGAAATLQH
jgi:transposase